MENCGLDCLNHNTRMRQDQQYNAENKIGSARAYCNVVNLKKAVFLLKKTVFYKPDIFIRCYSLTENEI